MQTIILISAITFILKSCHEAYFDIMAAKRDKAYVFLQEENGQLLKELAQQRNDFSIILAKISKESEHVWAHIRDLQKATHTEGCTHKTKETMA